MTKQQEEKVPPLLATLLKELSFGYFSYRGDETIVHYEHESLCDTNIEDFLTLAYHRILEEGKKIGREEKVQWNASMLRQLFAELPQGKCFTAKELYHLFEGLAPVFTKEQEEEIKNNLLKPNL